MAIENIDELNTLLTNTLEYKQFLKEQADSGYDSRSDKKISEFASIKNCQGITLMKLISELGGDVESSARITDQRIISWLPSREPSFNTQVDLIGYCLEAENNAMEQYRDLITRFEEESEFTEMLNNFIDQSENALDYFENEKRVLSLKYIS